MRPLGPRRRTSLTAPLAVLVAGLGLVAAPAYAAPREAGAAPATSPSVAATRTAHCARQSRIHVPGAQVQKTACLSDLTTAGTVASGHTNVEDWAGLNASGTRNPTGVPGTQVDGYFPDTSTTNTNNGWNHDAQFVIRFPDHWNGRLVVSGAPGTRRQYANDFLISDDVLAHGYAFAATDKGNDGAAFYDDGSTPGGSVREWNSRVTQLTKAAKRAVAQRYGHGPRRTYMAGLSNGGYLVRWQLENRPWLYDGGLDWEGTLFRASGPNLFTYLPTALQNYRAWRGGDAAAGQRMVAAGFEDGSQFLWDYHYAYYWDLTQRVYREEFDPTYDGALKAGVPFCPSGTPACDTDYDYASRPAAVKRAVASVQLTGRIRRPMLTVHGNLDTLLPASTDARVYDRLVKRAGSGRLHRTYEITGGNHVDGLYDTFPTRLRPILPCARSAFRELTAWVEHGRRPARSGVVPRPTSGDVVNTCDVRSR
ncbi:tannase/feruloyl esterase family alpha/beta hydrolase [Nocardioides korecus]